MRLAWLGTLAVASGCGGDPAVTVSAAYRVWCPPGTEPCSYANHVFNGPVPDEAEGIAVDCIQFSDHMTVGFTTLEGGPALSLRFGWNGALDTSDCTVAVEETDGRRWRSACGRAPPSAAAPCQIIGASAANGLELLFRCAGMPADPVQPGFEADLAHADEPTLPVAIVFSRCSTAAEVPGAE